MQNIAKNQIMKVQILDTNNSDIDNKKEGIEKRDAETLDLLMVQLYLHTITIIKIY